MTDAEDRLLAALYESERLPEIVRDDDFWNDLERLAPSDVSAAVQERFLRELPANEHPPMVKLWASLAANVAETIGRLGPIRARQELRETKH